MKLDRGYLIAFEGIDGVGKSTHCRMMVDHLQSRGLPALGLREPTQGHWGQKIRRVLEEGRGGLKPEEELSWFINDRKEDVEKNIMPALNQKKIVMIDRYYYSTAAYQGALGLDPIAILKENESFAPRPDRVFLFVAPPGECLKRIEEERGQHSAFERAEYLKKVCRIFDSFHGPDIYRINSVPPLPEVQAQLRRELSDLFPI